MILFLEYRSVAKTGGQYNQAHLYSFLRKRFPETLPGKRDLPPPEIAHPIKHAISSLTRAKKNSPKLIVVSLYSGCRNVSAVRFVRKNRGKVLLMHQGLRMTFRYKNPLGRWLARRCENYLLRNADIVQASSSFLAEEAKQETRKNAIIIIARPGLQVQPMLGEEVATSVERTGAFVNLLYVGECNKVKGTIYLIEAMGLLKDLKLRLDLVGGCSGESEYARKVLQLIEDNRLKDRITFHGAIDPNEIKKLYLGSSIFVMPSLSEGYGIALAEALCFGLPVIASRTGAIPEMVKDGLNAILVEPGNSAVLATAIRKLATSVRLRVAMSRANLERAKSLPRWDDYEEVLDRELVPAIEKLTGLKAQR